MHNILLRVLVLLGSGVGMVLLEQENLGSQAMSLSSNLSSQLANNPVGSAAGLQLPLSPSDCGTASGSGFTCQIEYYKASMPMKGGQLIETLFAQALLNWASTDNAPIVTPRQYCSRSSYDVRSTIVPALITPLAALTPLQVGVLFLRIMTEVLKRQTWPGMIVTSVNVNVPGGPGGLGPLPVGFVTLRNRLGVGDAQCFTPPVATRALHIVDENSTEVLIGSSNVQGNVSLDDPQLILQNTVIDEKAWLDVFVKMVSWVLSHPPQSRALDISQIRTRQSVVQKFSTSFDHRLISGIRVDYRATEVLYNRIASLQLHFLSEMIAAGSWRAAGCSIKDKDGLILANIGITHQ